MDEPGHASRRPTPVRPSRSHSGRPQNLSGHGHPGRPTAVAAGVGGPGSVSVISLVRVLLLNASHEPLAVVTGRRALVLVVAGKAECVIERADSSLIRSPSLAMSVPSVVRLRRYVRVPYQSPPAVTRAGILRRDQRRCAYCGSRGDTIDHVVPKSRGGKHSWENCVACCARCNARKADRLLDDLGWSLPFRPAAPLRITLGRLWSVGDTDPEWEPWLTVAA
jgi:5-methylcytosine-specific restriction endonuclease McrA